MKLKPISTKQTHHNYAQHCARVERAFARNISGSDFLIHYIAEEFKLRINAINREFTNAADFFSKSNLLSQDISTLDNVQRVSRFETSKIAGIINDQNVQKSQINHHWPQNIDLAISALGMHWHGDLALQFSSIFNAMKPDGLLMVALPIKGTLQELRESLTHAELETCDGAAMRVDPFGEMRDFGTLLQSVGFKLPVIDREQITVRYDNMHDLIKDLRAMAATACFDQRRPFVGRKIFEKAAAIYADKFSDADGRIKATFNFAYLTAWTPHASQQQPLQPGSAKNKMIDALAPKKR